MNQIKASYNKPKYIIESSDDLKKALKYYDVSVSSFARWLGINRTTVHLWLNNTNPVPLYIKRMFEIYSLFHPQFVHNRMSGKVRMDTKRPDNNKDYFQGADLD